MNETNIQALVAREIGGTPDARVFRNQVGNGWVGKFIDCKGGVTRLLNARRVSMGLCVGSADLVGFQRVTITPEMVGKSVAVFLSVEVKSEKGVTSQEQKDWRAAVERFGGKAGLVRTIADAKTLVANMRWYEKA